MPSSNTVTLAGLAKEIYPVSEIKDMEQKVTAFKKEIPEADDLTFSAKDGGTFQFPVKASGPHGQKMLNEQESLPGAQTSNVVQGTANIKEYAGVLQFTKRELELAKGDPQSFANAKTFEMECLIEQAHKYFNRQCARGDGQGAMTTVSGAIAPAATVWTVADATPFMIGQVIDVFDVTYPAAGSVKVYSAGTVTDIDLLATPQTVTLDTGAPGAGFAGGESIVISGVGDNRAADGKEMTGLPLVTDDGTLAATFQGITRAGAGAVPNYRGISLDALAGAISVTLINQMCTRALRIGGTDFVNANDAYFLFPPEQWRAYAALATPLVRFMPTDSADQNKPFTQYECAGKRAVLDTDVQNTKVYLLRKNAVEMAVSTPLDWEEDLGGTSLKWLSGYAQGIMVLYSLQQMFSRSPRDAIVLDNLAPVAI